MIWPFFVLGVAGIIASGSLFRHQRILTLLATAAALVQLAVMVLTLLHRTVWPGHASEVFIFGSFVFLALALLESRSWHLPYQTAGSGRRDIFVLAALLPVLLSAWFIQRANGLRDAEWIAHGFYNGDTTTFIALVQKSFLSEHLVRTNPFAGNGPLEYPTLVHASLADVLTQLGLGLDWLYFLPFIVLRQIIITIPLFFLLRDVVKEAAGYHSGYRWGWRGLLLEAAVIVYILALSWESYVYPQGHFFTGALFLLLCAGLVRAWSRRDTIFTAWPLVGFVLTLILVLSNAVTGTAAAGVWGVFALLCAFDKQRVMSNRAWFGMSILLLAYFFVSFTPGQGALSLTPWFSYAAVPNMMMLSGPLLLLLIAQLYQLRRHAFVAVATVALAWLGLITFIFSDREIIVENSSRFLYHALLVGWPLAIDSIVRNVRVVQAHMRRLDWLPLQVSSVAGVFLAFGLLAWPALASVANVHDNLLGKNEQRVGVDIREAMQWIVENSAPEAVFLAHPQEPWVVPLFTGRALLRTDYWLSPGDELQETVVHAFAGDGEAQAKAEAQADYLLIGVEDQDQWGLPIEKRVYNFANVAIYDLRK